MAEELELKDRLSDLRKSISLIIGQVQKEADNRPRCGAEIMLALRHLQDAYWRLDVAKDMETEKNTWSA